MAWNEQKSRQPTAKSHPQARKQNKSADQACDRRSPRREPHEAIRPSSSAETRAVRSWRILIQPPVPPPTARGPSPRPSARGRDARRGRAASRNVGARPQNLTGAPSRSLRSRRAMLPEGRSRRGRIAITRFAPHGREFTPKRTTPNILRDCDPIVADAKLRMANMREVPVSRALPRVFARYKPIFQSPKSVTRVGFGPNRLE